jgi:uncharacterized protein YbbC (DUF1343 family)
MERLRRASVGVLANPTSVTPAFDHLVDALVDQGVEPVRLFGPEHGVRAAAQDMESVDGGEDPVTGIPTVSLYGDDLESLKPDPAQVADLDVLVADIQDVGARYYTYASTVGFAMETCGQTDTEVWVLDRPNPIRGDVVEGNRVDPEYRSFVGTQPIANRHGMTLGELATYFDRFGGWSCDLDVVPMTGWRREMWYDDTGLPWVKPSPNMPTLETATVYPGQCLLEGTDASEGRGTTTPFELFGAPSVDPSGLRERLAAYDLKGVGWREVSFRPMFQKHAGQTVHGLQLHITDRDVYRSMEVGFAVIAALVGGDNGVDWRTEPYEFVSDRLAIDLLLGDRKLREALTERDASPTELANAARRDLDPFLDKRADCLLYHD